MSINCFAQNSWWYDVFKMIGKKIKMVFFYLSVLKMRFNLLSLIFFACLFVCLFFSF